MQVQIYNDHGTEYAVANGLKMQLQKHKDHRYEYAVANTQRFQD